jgi:hypothetical protein
MIAEPQPERKGALAPTDQHLPKALSIPGAELQHTTIPPRDFVVGEKEEIFRFWDKRIVGYIHTSGAQGRESAGTTLTINSHKTHQYLKKYSNPTDSHWDS